MSLAGATACIHSPWPQWREDALCQVGPFQSCASEDEMRLSLGHFWLLCCGAAVVLRCCFLVSGLAGQPQSPEWAGPEGEWRKGLLRRQVLSLLFNDPLEPQVDKVQITSGCA